MSQDLDTAKIAVERAEAERREVKKLAWELVERVKSEAETQRYMIDRRMITQFLLNFMSPKATPLMRTQIADALSKILQFSNDERAQLGLKAIEGNVSPNLPAGATLTIADKLISYFLLDD